MTTDHRSTTLDRVWIQRHYVALGVTGAWHSVTMGNRGGRRAILCFPSVRAATVVGGRSSVVHYKETYNATI